MYSMVTIVNNTVAYLQFAKRVDLKHPDHKKKEKEKFFERKKKEIVHAMKEINHTHRCTLEDASALHWVVGESFCRDDKKMLLGLPWWRSG